MKKSNYIKLTAISLIMLLMLGCEDKQELSISEQKARDRFFNERILYAELRDMPVYDNFTYTSECRLIMLSSRFKIVEERVKKVVVTKREENLTEAEVTYYSGRGEYVMKYSGSGKTYTSGMPNGGIKGADTETTGIVLRSIDNNSDALIVQRYCYGVGCKSEYELGIIIHD